MRNLVTTIILAAVAGIANAETNTGVYIPFGVMAYDYDESARVLDANVMPTVGIGYRFDQHLATELMAAQGDTDVDMQGGGEADVRHYRLDALYFLDEVNEGLTPYVVGGVSHGEFDYDLAGTYDDTQLNVGAGLMYQLDYNWALRGDVRAINSLDNDNTEAAVNLLVQYNFGSPAPVVAAAPVAPPADNDKDGVVNTKDLCPNTPPNKTVDENGCDCNYTLHLGFEFDSAELHAADFAILDQIQSVLKNLGYVHANVTGHTDDQGEEAYNQELSQRRAAAVVDYFTSKGLNKEMFTPMGRGESEPVADNSTDAGRAENRRVMLERDDCGR
jgi:OOP family OmpA-OmpF porin